MTRGSLSVTSLHSVVQFCFEAKFDGPVGQNMAGDQITMGAEDVTHMRPQVLDYIRKHGDNLTFTKFFWKGCEPNDYELRRYSDYVRVMQECGDRAKLSEISARTGVLSPSIHAWISFRQKPKLAHFLALLLRLGEPKLGFVWLSVNNTSRHGIPSGPMLQVPLKIRSWGDVETLIEQIPLGSGIELVNSRAYMLGFLLGIMIGDAAKKRQKTWHRHLELVLSKRYGTSVRIGDFTTQCARSLGLRMKRMKDISPSNKPNEFYVWESQSSALVDWIFNVCLGLKDGELTTYNPVAMGWALDAPRDFRCGLIQGLAESDGSVNVSGQEVEFWIGPSWDFVQGLLGTFGVRAFRSREALTISKSQVRKALEVPIFAPHLATVRYQKFVSLANANHIPHGTRLPKDLRDRITALAREGFSVPTISERVLADFGIILTYEAVQRWARKAVED